ncbi:MAG: hypothetical protein H6721_15865 [Sandaracinus sp.]|nr:hypothetical protein [Sandaracinus sp.]
MTRSTPSTRRSRRHEEGAVMLIVMLVLLTTTALAVFAIHATTTEVRAAGHDRMGSQAQEIGESGLAAAHTWVDVFGPDALSNAMAASSRVVGNTYSLPQPFEPALAADRQGYRLYARDFEAVVNATSGGAVASLDLDQADLGGANRLYSPSVVVDVYDNHQYTGVLAGYRSDGNSLLRFLGATYTSRGRLRLTAADGSLIDSDDGSGRGFYDSSSDARARGVSGPF